ncbi:hypothetical protein GUITHDRAFT_85507 [Guillardia theta CCMP2712]|uniref:Cycloeucalenol cycloisomerase n=2 Tax=Guillardia theta TaxID=55529 RepID=L1JNX1_GUITC|nr:hypothetical protein GUITHDRAFT_85507 [Guillardia theta CCMP2712]EKX49885.1 hypothetical protein GUITHDRAFT_85507 [Guillardia theta CCMP2712]|mmetsp:Transcript_25838/g.85117  ORF Transcript_25838/g.85117 Transcript_25838/m.85117 type:complete len:322 (+) Transcript_25838:59-1024(+)|eukprot:XP_005836865.1 hypothetical protein GUITHDRAFT_85507 [Guillardia theta CCMP2712]
MASPMEILQFVASDPALRSIGKIIATLLVSLFSISLMLKRTGSGYWLAPKTSKSKRACELWFLVYGCFWISCFGIIIALRLYDDFDRKDYFLVCGGLMLPLLLQPVLFPKITADDGRPLLERHSFKANVWIFIFGFIGNYWYTHYFYNVLKASYTMKSWDVNGVPIPMFFATHFYFTFYHALSNMAIRKAVSTYENSFARTIYLMLLIFTMSYITAFMEALTISGFSCYSFADRHMAWILGSAFYGIYFIVSFPMYYRVDELKVPHSAFQAAIESLASGMMVLCLLDFVRVYLNLDLEFRLNRPCKLDGSLTCAPFTGQIC